MRKSLIITAIILLLCMCGCETVSQVPAEAEPDEVSNMVLTPIVEAESTQELEAATKSSVDISGPVIEPIETSEPEESEKAVDSREAVITENGEGKTSSESETIPSFELAEPPTTSEAAKEKQVDPPVPSEPPKEKEQSKPTEPPAPTESPAPTEPPAPVETKPPAETQPKTAYDYEFDINAIRSDCIAIGQNMGYTLNTSLTPQNATWWNPVTASESNQGSSLRSALEQYIRFHTVDNLGAYGLDEINEFNICCESRGNGSYAIYFVFA